MKTRTPMFAVVLLLLASLPVPAGPIQAGSPSERVSSLLLKFPADSSAEKDAAADELIKLGTAAVIDLCGRLAEPGKGDDSLVRFALDAMVVRAGRPGSYAERISVVEGILKGLETVRNTENAVFLISLLQSAGKAEIIKPLARYLARPGLTGPVVRALSATGMPEASDTLLKALKKARGPAAAAIIRGLGDLRGRNATSTLVRLAGGRDPDIRAAALDALADIGDPAARPALERVGVAAPFAERAAAASRLLLFGRRLAESGRTRDAAGIARPLIDGYTAPEENHICAAALNLYMDAVGEKEGLAVLLEAAVSSDLKYRQKALDIAAGLRSAWQPSVWIGLLAQTPADVQADIIRLFDRRGEASAIPVILEMLRTREGPVRAVAAVAAARRGGPGILDDLLPLVKSGDAAELRAARTALSFFPSDVLIPRVAAWLPDAPPPGQAMFLGILAERKAVSQSALVLSFCASPDDGVRAAALAALEPTATAADLPALADLLLASEKGPETVLIQNAVVAAAGGIPDREERAGILLQALGRTSGTKRIDLLRPLFRIGGAAALEAVRAEIANPDPQIQSVAVYTLANWPDESVIPDLFRLAKSAPDRKTRYLALQGIARLVPASSVAPAGKLTALSEALAAAVETDEKVVVLNGLAASRIPEGLKLIAAYLEDPAVRPRAAQAVLKLVMPATGYGGMKGREAAAVLKKALPSIDYEFDRIPGEFYARELLLEEGFKPLFNGKDLSGWKGLVADPPKRAKMSPVELATAQSGADADMRAHWQVLDGALAFDGKGHSLCTAADYGDFEMFVDWKIASGGDSGIYLRGSPQVQIWDPAQWPEGSGGLYNNQKNPSKPSVRADRPIGEWNTFYIRMAGDRVTVELNGVRVVDDVVMENYWERGKPIYPSGQIELQAHSTPLEFRNIYLREIPAGEAAELPAPGRRVSSDESEEGFVPLFNGRDLTGWIGDLKGYAVENGAIVVSPEGSGNLYTAGTYADFVFRFEFKLTPGANNGIGIRTPPEGDAAYVGMEIQVLDDTADQYRDLKPYQYHGSVYGIVPARRGFQRAVGEWNSEEIAIRGRKISVTLNGTKIVEADLDEASTPRTMDGREHPGLTRESGYICFCGHGSRVEFRNLRIREWK